MVTLRTGMGTSTMRPAVSARTGSTSASTTTTTATAIIGTAGATTGGGSDALRRTVRGRAGPQQRHHLRHLSEESSFASSKGRITLLKRGVGSIGWEGDRRRGFRRNSVEKTLSDKVGHGGNSIGLMGRLLVKNVASGWERAKIALGVTKVSEHISPGAFSGRASIPNSKILLENGLAGKNHIRHVHHLLRSHGRESMLGEISEIVDSVENSVNR